MKKKVMEPKNYNNLLDRIADILAEARTKVVREINKAQGLAYWEIRRLQGGYASSNNPIEKKG